jgi:hypothetical protein
MEVANARHTLVAWITTVAGSSTALFRRNLSPLGPLRFGRRNT